KWRTKQRRVAPNGVLQGFVTTVQFLPQPGSRDKDQVGMAIRMISNRMARLMDGPHNIRALASIFADQKESGFSSMFGQELEQLKCIGIIGAVVESKRHL